MGSEDKAYQMNPARSGGLSGCLGSPRIPDLPDASRALTQGSEQRLARAGRPPATAYPKALLNVSKLSATACSAGASPSISSET